MADEYIRREDALHALYEDYAYPAMDIIKGAPAADVAEVVHGVWAVGDDDVIECSCCAAEFDLVCLEPEDFKYCPHCGAKMDGGENDVSG